MSSEVVLKLEKVSKQYLLYANRRSHFLNALFPRLRKKATFTAVDSVDLEIRKGECVGIMGVNGSGKSTLLQMIAGIVPPTSGSLSSRGKIMPLLELGTWFEPKETGRENILITGYAQGLKYEDIIAKTEQIAEFAEIGDFIDQPVSTYSTGMLMRLAFATNIFIDADILLLDEVFAVGDMKFVQKCMHFIRNFIKDKTVIFVSHDTNIISNMCSRAILMNKGKKIIDGTTAQVTEKYLELCYGMKQDIAASDNSAEASAAAAAPSAQPAADCRGTVISSEVQIDQDLSDSSWFGKLDARITNAYFTDACGNPKEQLNSGEMVKLHLDAVAEKDLLHPSFGFIVKDPTGRYLFGDTTLYAAGPEKVAAGESFFAEFEFFLPRLANGEYPVAAAVASGEQINHVQQHWVHRALVLKISSAAAFQGLIMGLPMNSIVVGKQE